MVRAASLDCLASLASPESPIGEAGLCQDLVSSHANLTGLASLAIVAGLASLASLAKLACLNNLTGLASVASLIK